MAQTDGHKSLSSASTLGTGWPWLPFSLEELHWWWPWRPVVRRNWTTVERWDTEESPLDPGISPWNHRNIWNGNHRKSTDNGWWLCRDVLSRWCLMSSAWWQGALQTRGTFRLGSSFTTCHTLLPPEHHTSTNRWWHSVTLLVREVPLA